jgi:DNA helicase-2/ATP-dependent DNA helicase PcrA
MDFTGFLPPTPAPSTRVWSPQQLAIFDWFEHPAVNPETDGPLNLTVRARAGTGKTTTIVEGVNRAPETSILFAAFNKRIADELKGRITNPYAEACTLHSLGFRLVRGRWKVDVDNKNRAYDLTRMVAKDPVPGKTVPPSVVDVITKLHTVIREMAPIAHDSTIREVGNDLDLFPEDEWMKLGYTEDWCVAQVQAILIVAANKPVKGTIDYADMIFLPIRNGWLRPMFDLVVVDEMQDMNAAQLTLAKGVLRPGGRFCGVGDDRQGIYGFRGADTGSIDRIKAEMDATELPLTVTYRCGVAIVKEANRLVPDFEAGPSNSAGRIETVTIDELSSKVQPGDFVLSRINAPLVSVAMGLIKDGIRTRIEGRDVAAGLRKVVDKVTKAANQAGAYDIPGWLEHLTEWYHHEQAKAIAKDLDRKAEFIGDQYEVLTIIADSVTHISGIAPKIEQLFAPGPGPGGGFVVCSSVHKSKGLEAERVFILRDTLYPGKGKGKKQSAKRSQEEANIEYVAITRAIKELYWVAGGR